MRKLVAGSSLPRPEFEKQLFNHDWIRRYERGEITTAEYHRHLQEEGGLRLSLTEFHDAWSSVFLPGLIVPEEFLGHLKQRYPLVLVSNTNALHVEFISQKYNVLDYFHEHIFSHEVGSLKPDRKIYEAAISAAGKPATELFFTDDRLENIEAALEMGIHAHLFHSFGGLVEALRGQGVDVGDFVPA